jgi:membrane fusion protein (multidrug efflux system)
VSPLLESFAFASAPASSIGKPEWRPATAPRPVGCGLLEISMPLPSMLRGSLVVAVGGVALVAGCGQQASQGGGMGGFPPAEVSVVTLAPAQFPVTFEYVGQTAGSKDAEVRARVTGIVERKLYREGAPVKAGQPLFLLDPKPFEAQLASAEAELAKAQAQKTQADREAARLKPLAERRAIGQKEADDAATAADLAAAGVKVAEARVTEAKLNLAYTRVNAPISGLSSRAQQSEGSLATANTTLLTTVSQVDPLWIVFSVSENEQQRLNRAVAEGKLTLPPNHAFDVTIRLSDGTTLPSTGRITFADNRVSPSTGTYEMRAEVPNTDLALKPGQFVRVVLKGGQRRNALAVPQVALLEGPQGKFVYVLGKDKEGRDIAQPRSVTVGAWAEREATNMWLIESGLAEGDRVIVDGTARIMMPNSPVKLAEPATASGQPSTVPGGTSAPPPGNGKVGSPAETQRK